MRFHRNLVEEELGLAQFQVAEDARNPARHEFALAAEERALPLMEEDKTRQLIPLLKKLRGLSKSSKKVVVIMTDPYDVNM